MPISPNTEKSKSEAAEIRDTWRVKVLPISGFIKIFNNLPMLEIMTALVSTMAAMRTGICHLLMHSRTSVSTVKENRQWHGYKADLKDSGIYANEDVDSSVSVTEINIYPNDLVIVA